MKYSTLPYYGQFFERFSFWGLQSIFVLYLTVAKHLPEDIVYQDYGFFTACAFVLALLGGITADKFIGFRSTIICGISLACMGNIILALGNVHLLSFGLMSIALGAGLFISTNPNFLALQQSAYPIKQLNNITLLYLSENLAFIMGSFCYGIIWDEFGVKYCFMLSACLLAAYLIIFIYNTSLMQNYTHNNVHNQQRIKVAILLSSMLIGLSLLMQFSASKNSVIVCIAIASLIYHTWRIYRAPRVEKPALLTLIMMFLICLIFFTVLFQMNSSLLMFIQTHVQKSLFTWNIPASAFAALESLFATMWAPIFGVIWYRVSKKMLIVTEMRKVALSLLLQSIGFYIFIQAMRLAALHSAGISPFAILPGYALLGAGDICLMPTVINAVTRWAPAQLRGVFMGIFYVVIGFSGYLAGNLADLTISVERSVSPLMHTITIFHQFNTFAFIVSLLILSLSLLLRNKY